MDTVSRLFKLHIYDYLSKQSWNVNTAKQFSLDAQLGSHGKPSLDVPQGFLSEWWTVLWVHLPSSTNESDDMGDYKLHAYIHEYLVKHGFHVTARTFLNELNIDKSFNVTLEGHLFEYWAEFWKLYKAKRGSTTSSDTTMHIEVPEKTQAGTQLQQSRDGSTSSIYSIGTQSVSSFADPSLAPVHIQVPLYYAHPNELPTVQGLAYSDHGLSPTDNPNASIAISNNTYPLGLPYQTQRTPDVYPHASSSLPLIPFTGDPTQPLCGMNLGAILAAPTFPQPNSSSRLDIPMQWGYGSGGGSLDVAMPHSQHSEQSISALPSNVHHSDHQHSHSLWRRATIGDLSSSPYGFYNASNTGYAGHGRKQLSLPQHHAFGDVAQGVEIGTQLYEAEYRSQVQSDPILLPLCQSPSAMEDPEELLKELSGHHEDHWGY